MKRKRLKLTIAFLLVVLVLGGLILSANGSSTIYLMSVNDKVFEMTADNMPIMSGNQLYIPYTMLSSQETGVNLGVRVQYNSSRGTLTVTDGKQTFSFDIRKNAAYDQYGNVLKARVLVRNSMAYVPVDWLCNSFTQLKYSLTNTPYGTLVRVTSTAARLSDAELIDTGEALLRENWSDYQDSLVVSTPTATPTATTSDPPPSLDPTPTTSAEPAPLVYLAFRWGSQASTVADLLEENSQRALFLLDCKQLIQQDDLVRRLIARGHQVGLVLTCDDVDDCLTELEQGRQLMNDIARSPILIASAPELSLGDQQTLEEAGNAIWTATLQADGMDISTLQERIEAQRSNYVELTCDQAGLDLLKRLMPVLIGDGYRLRQALAPML